MKFVRLALMLAALAVTAVVCVEALAQEPVPEPEKKQEGENGEAKKDDGEKKEDGEKKKEEDDNSQLSCKDGAFIIGRIDIDKFEIETDYGKLVVPRDQVIKIRIGKNADKDLKKKITDLIAKLGHEEFKEREDATKELGALGGVALEELREAAKSDDVEVKTRAEKLVKEIEQTLSPEDEEVIDDDEIVAVKFTIRGTLLVDKFKIATRYGMLELPKKDIKAVLVSTPSGVTKTVVVAGASHTGESMKDTGIDVKKGDKIVISATGTVYIRNWGVNVSPEGDPSYGTHYSGIPAGALMGKIGASGRLFKVYLGIGVRNRYSNTGEFQCKVQIDRK
jgi:hypothetical protein